MNQTQDFNTESPKKMALTTYEYFSVLENTNSCINSTFTCHGQLQ